MRDDCDLCTTGEVHYHASDLGKCARGVVAEKLGEKPIPHDDRTLLRFGEGNLHEKDVIVNRLPALGYVVRDQQRAGSLTVAGVPVVYHLDGAINGAAGVPLVLEVKAPSRDEYKKWIATGWDTPGLWQHYKWQVSLYMHAMGMELMMAVKNRDTGQLDLSVQGTPFYTTQEIAAKVAYFEDHRTRGVLPETCPHEYFCQYKWLCPAVESKEEADVVVEPVLEDVLRDYAAATAAIKEAKATKAALQTELEILLAGRTRVRTTGWTVTWVQKEVPEHVVKASHQSYPLVKKVEETPDAASTE